MPFHVDTGGLLVIDDTNWQKYAQDVIDGEVRFRGYEQRDYSKEPYGSATPYAVPMTIPNIPESEWPDRIEQIHKDKALVSERAKRSGIKVYNQGSTNYCWANGTLKAFEITRVLQGLDHIPLSPASIAAPITGFRNVGGWGTQALKYLGDHGACPTAVWGNNSIDRRLDNAETKKAREPFRNTMWFDVEPGVLAPTMTLLLLGMPVAVAYNYWRHLVLALDPIRFEDGTYGFGCWNSWGENYGDKGYFVLKGSKAVPSEAVCPAQSLVA